MLKMIPNPTENTVVLYHKISSIKIRKVSIIRLLLHFPIHLDLYALRRWRSPFSFASTKNLPPFSAPRDILPWPNCIGNYMQIEKRDGDVLKINRPRKNQYGVCANILFL